MEGKRMKDGGRNEEEGREEGGREKKMKEKRKDKKETRSGGVMWRMKEERGE